VRGSPEEAVGEQPYRAKANCRKASTEGESAGSDEDPIFVGAVGVMAAGWLQSLLALPSEICWVP
jgi:hypothetical protein